MGDAPREFKAGIFQALASPTRIAIVELLRDEGEVVAGRIHQVLGIEQANASQHLAVLRGKNIVVARKDGKQVFYSLRDDFLGDVLNLMKRYFQAHVSGSLDILREIGEVKGRP